MLTHGLRSGRVQPVCPSGEVVGGVVGAAGAVSRRPLRVLLLSVAIVLMSLADLQITMTYLRSGGMGEGNPVARLVMEHGSQSLLVLWKCASVAFACLIFCKYRTHRCAEIACWVSFIVLAWLLVRWINYSDEAWKLTPALHTMHEADVAQWVRMAD